MTSEELRNQLIEILEHEFPLVQYKKTVLKSGNIRVSPYLPNNRKNKRWMQLDANPEYLSIAMDHSTGDFKYTDLNNLNLTYGLNGFQSAIQIQPNNDAINISIFTDVPYPFSNKAFIDFLHKHYESYNKIIF
ncbi:hypothetical protein [Bacillus testis]|uniref:hypothetical protein n=1 Tax=Bacillus testis TaxID=1622072 RepID=UPI00067ED653|nr:hypothetical protein [Bacillus testis]